jgi:hypothetical protein
MMVLPSCARHRNIAEKIKPHVDAEGSMTTTTTIDCFAGAPPKRGYVNAGTTRLSCLEWGDQGALLLLVADLQYTVVAPDTLAAAERALRSGLGRLAKVPGTTHNMHRGAGFGTTMALLTGWLAETRG